LTDSPGIDFLSLEGRAMLSGSEMELSQNKPAISRSVSKFAMRWRGHCGLWRVHDISKFENPSAMRNGRLQMEHTDAEVGSIEHPSFPYVMNFQSPSMIPRIPTRKGGSQIDDQEKYGFPDPVHKTQLAQNSAEFYCFPKAIVISLQYDFDI
jgi:hypothetical protein